jgi:hypothetical protein
MDRRATLCPDSLLPPAPSTFSAPLSLTALMIVAHLKFHAEHNWSVTSVTSVTRSTIIGIPVFALIQRVLYG